MWCFFVSWRHLNLTPGFNVSITLCVLLMLGWLGFLQTLAAPTYLHHNCSDDYGNNSDFIFYENNLDTLLSLLTNEASKDDDGFANCTAGQSPDKLYGLYLCRGDLGMQDCYDCVTFAALKIRELCYYSKAIVWYNKCLLRHSSEYIFSTMDLSSGSAWGDIKDVEPRHFESIIGYLASEAANSKSGKKLAVTNSAFEKYPYALVQCTPDLTVEDCSTCIKNSSRAYYNNSEYPARVVTPSCILIIQSYQFFNETVLTVDETPFLQNPLTKHKGKNTISHGLIIALAAMAALFAALLFTGCYLLRRWQQKKHDIEPDKSVDREITAHQDALKFDFGVIQLATNNFTDKLGAGGFSEVYKGILPSGQDIAVKKLSIISQQDVEGFKNEVITVAKLQHRNLVQLLGFCMTGKEKLLVYEFVPNKSLDFFLFDNEKRILLDWMRRYNIAVGIARGLLYLHQDSTLHIIRRDIKASNILLGSDFNPKISDFGMARILGVHGTLQNTNEVVGSYGYMAPEYAMHGHFSEKSDVYSYGILLLEILSGKKNVFNQSECIEDLPTYAWKHWKDRTPLHVLDSSLRGSFSRSEALRCIHISLLCVQEDPSDRPSMATIVHMLNDYSVALSMPRQPAFFFSNRGPRSNQVAISSSSSSSINEVAITTMYPR